MSQRILLVNPAIYDFSAYDFWLKPYGMLRVAGYLRQHAELSLFDYLDRNHPSIEKNEKLREDKWGRGQFHQELVEKPDEFSSIRRRFKRFGLPRENFQKFLQESEPFDYAFIQTVMTFWVMGAEEVIEDLRKFSPQTKIVLGGVYATICNSHANNLNVDFVVNGTDLNPLWDWMGFEPDYSGLPFWEGYSNPTAGVLKLADGCPFKCTYCSVPQVYPKFFAREMDRSIAEFEHLIDLNIRSIVFYDDALLFKPKEILLPFLRRVQGYQTEVNFHTPNALNARFITKEIALEMVSAGFKTFYLGFESNAFKWQKSTGGKVYSHEFTRAVENLIEAGAEPKNITAYLIIAHPNDQSQDTEDSLKFVNQHGVRVMLSEFAPIPGTPDGESCRSIIDLDSPLNHNKTAFSIRNVGEERVNELKDLCHKLNNNLNQPIKMSA